MFESIAFLWSISFVYWRELQMIRVVSPYIPAFQVEPIAYCGCRRLELQWPALDQLSTHSTAAHNRAVINLFNEVLTNISAPIVSRCLLLCRLHLHRTTPTDLQEHHTSVSPGKSPFRGLIEKIYSLILVTKFSSLSLYAWWPALSSAEF